MKILLTVASFTPEYGGPAYSVSRLGFALSAQGEQVFFWAPDGSAVTSSVFDKNTPASVQRLTGNSDCILDKYKPDIVHDNGIWLPYNFVLARRCRERGIKRILSPRGMLEPWALEYKRWKKKAAWITFQRHDLHTASGIHATSEAEAASLKRFKTTAPVFVIRNGIDVPVSKYKRVVKDTRMRTALFLSRVHPKKGLPMLILAWAKIRPTNWRLVIAGGAELNHSDDIQSLIEKHHLSDFISVVGPQYGEAKVKLFRNADLFVLPTYSENFGMVIAESLANGIPVITTTGAPWKDLETFDCGWWVEPSVSGIGDGLRTAMSKTDVERMAMGERGRKLMKHKYDWVCVAKDMVNEYKCHLKEKAKLVTDI